MEVREIRRMSFPLKGFSKIRKAKELADSLSRKIIELDLKQLLPDSLDSMVDMVALDKSNSDGSYGSVLVRISYTSPVSAVDAFEMMKKYVKASEMIEGFPKFFGNTFSRIVLIDGLPDIWGLNPLGSCNLSRYFLNESDPVQQGKTRVEATVTGYMLGEGRYDDLITNWADAYSQSDSKCIITSTGTKIFESEPRITFHKTFDSLDPKAVNEFCEKAKKYSMPFLLFWEKCFDYGSRSSLYESFELKNVKFPVRRVEPSRDLNFSLYVSVGNIERTTLVASYKSGGTPFEMTVRI